MELRFDVIDDAGIAVQKAFPIIVGTLGATAVNGVAGAGGAWIAATMSTATLAY
jgi:hypothetical protein